MKLYSNIFQNFSENARTIKTFWDCKPESKVSDNLCIFISSNQGGFQSQVQKWSKSFHSSQITGAGVSRVPRQHQMAWIQSLSQNNAHTSKHRKLIRRRRKDLSGQIIEVLETTFTFFFFSCLYEISWKPWFGHYWFSTFYSSVVVHSQNVDYWITYLLNWIWKQNHVK